MMMIMMSWLVIRMMLTKEENDDDEMTRTEINCMMTRLDTMMIKKKIN